MDGPHLGCGRVHGYANLEIHLGLAEGVVADEGGSTGFPPVGA